MSKSPTYRSWADMIGHCTNPKRSDYKNYGGRGIAVCSRWFSFSNFFADMGECPTGYTLDRKNTDGGYCPKNCKWSTKAEQSRDRRTTQLSEDKVRLLRVLWGAKAPAVTRKHFAAVVAPLFSVSPWTIIDVVSGKTWSN